MSRDRLVCAGSLTLDNVVTADGRQLPQTCGGNVIYSALGARIWHDRVDIVSRCGSDFPEACLDRLGERGLSTGGIRRLDRPHGMNVAFCYAADGSRVRAFPPAVMAAIDPAERARFTDYTTFGPAHRFATWTAFAPDGDDIPADWLAGIAGVHCAAMPVERHLSIAGTIGDGPGAWVQVDSPWYDERDLSIDHARPLFAGIDAILPSEDDVEKARPGARVEATVAAMIEAGAKLVVLKRGGRGCEIHRPGAAVLPVPAWAGARAIDPTGAGDAFCGGFLAGMLKTGDALQAALYGTVSASFAIEAPGFAGLFAATGEEAAARLADLRQAIAAAP